MPRGSPFGSPDAISRHEVFGEFVGGPFSIMSVNEVVAFEHGEVAVAGDLHDDGIMNAGAPHVGHESVSQVVEDEPAGSLAPVW